MYFKLVTILKALRYSKEFQPAIENAQYCLSLNSLWLANAIWQHRSGSTLAQVMACYISCDIHLKATSQDITKISFKIIYIKFYTKIPGTNELVNIFHWTTAYPKCVLLIYVTSVFPTTDKLMGRHHIHVLAHDDRQLGPWREEVVNRKHNVGHFIYPHNKQHT